MFLSIRRQAKTPRLPEGRRLYAIGDIHGEAALLRDLLARIEADARVRDPMRTTLVFLGDFIDRGARAADLLRGFCGSEGADLVFLKGNHEAALVDVYRGDEEALAFWIRFGGRATLQGLGIDVPASDRIDPAQILWRLREALDVGIIDWLDALPHSFSLGDYFFCHAGVRPGIPLRRQDQDDLLWIREPFLSSDSHHGKIIVHGHTVDPDGPVIRRNRIGLDTGAHEHGRLTAIGLEGREQWVVQTSAIESDRAPEPHRPPWYMLPDIVRKRVIHQ